MVVPEDHRETETMTVDTKTSWALEAITNAHDALLELDHCLTRLGRGWDGSTRQDQLGEMIAELDVARCDLSEGGEG